MTAVILQSRLGSTRLPGKAMLPLADRTVTQHALKALRGVEADLYILATDPDSSGILGATCREEGFHLFVGDPRDVLARYCGAIRAHGVSTVVRATGDNPLVSAEAANLLLELQRHDPADYRGLTGMPVGTGVEIVRASALLRAEIEARDPEEREHVCPYLYRNPDRFRVELEPCPDIWRLPDRSVTLDTEQDYRFLTHLFETLYQGDPVLLETLVSWLRNSPNSTAVIA